jgi:hypothetical protein
MSDFTTATVKQPDLGKRVNYTFGLVLGVDEFQQEQGYLIERTRLHSRSLHGYGTITGLSVTAADTVAGPEIRVSPGSGLNPRGQHMCVPNIMCARLNAWLQTNRSDLLSTGFSPPGNLQLAVALCYRECPTDSVPVPGEPCRTQDTAIVPSRIQDAFELQLVLDQPEPVASLPSLPLPPSPLPFLPDQVEEEGVRRFGELLARIAIANVASSNSNLELANAVRSLGFPGDPMPALGSFSIRPDQASERLGTVFRTWVTEVQPRWLSAGTGAACKVPDETCILLAGVTVPVGATFQVNGGASAIGIDEARRPVLLSTRLLQEYVRRATAGAPPMGAPGDVPMAVVAAGRFAIGGGGAATAVGPVLNSLTATVPGGSPTGAYLLSWTGSAPYVTPDANHTYVVKGHCLAAVADANRHVFEILDYRSDGILIRALNTAGTLTTPGFVVEVTRIGVQP